MMRRIFSFLILPGLILTGLLAAPPAGAKEGITLVGAGATTCGTFNDEFEDDPARAEDVYFAWAQGYLVGLNSRSDLFYELKPGDWDGEKQKAFLNDYCGDHADEDYIEAVRALYRQIVTANIALDQ